MENFISIAQTISPIGVIFTLVIIVWQLIKGSGIMERIRGAQDTTKATSIVSLAILSDKLDAIASNHLHGLPDMNETLKRIDSKSDKMVELLIEIKTNIKDRV